MSLPSVQSYFNKKIKFKSDDCFLPPVDAFFSTENAEKHESLQMIKSILNYVKSKLNYKDIDEWSQHTRNRNPAQEILKHLKSSVHGEFVTQAFAKFFECCSAYPMIGNFEKVFQSVHLCEAPGAFITALNHYMKLHHPEAEFRWRASTLNPYYEGNDISKTILDDRLISQTLENWVFGEDYDGDILKEGNLRSLIAYCKSLGNVNLVTGDGSIDCLDQPENQEEFVSKLHLAEVIAGLAILADKGCLLTKMFTFFEESTIAMLYILNCCFNELHVFKPATSKEGNSEVYVIGLGYKKDVMSDEIIEKMIVNLNDPTKVLLSLNVIPPSFQAQVNEAAKIFMNLQVKVIEGNINTFRKYDIKERERIRVMKELLVDEYVRRYSVAAIRDNQKILHGALVNNQINLNVRVHTGSHADRQIFLTLPRADQAEILNDRLSMLYGSIFLSAFNSLCVPQRLSNHRIDLKTFIKPIYGRPIERVVSSKFILVTLVKYLNELRTFLETGRPEDAYDGSKFSVRGNHLDVDIEYFRKAQTYEAYEKEVILELLRFLLDEESEIYIVDSLPLFTQFTVGVVLYLAMYVFEEIQLKRSGFSIHFKSMTPNGKDNIKFMIKTITNDQRSPKALLGICDTKLLFSFSQEFYRSVVDYNNQLCLKFCTFYLNSP